MSVSTSIIIPTFNEIDNIGTLLDELTTVFDKNNQTYEILVVDDGSKDGTAAFIDEYHQKKSQVKPLHRRGAKGIGSAIWYGMNHAEGDGLITVMGDRSDDPEDVLNVALELQKGFDVVYTNRFKKKNRAYKYPFFKFFFNRGFNSIIATVFKIPYNDTSNAFKGISRNIQRQVNIKFSGFEFTTELAIKSYFIGSNFSEVPVAWYDRAAGEKKSNLLVIGVGYIRVLMLLQKLRKKYGK